MSRNPIKQARVKGLIGLLFFWTLLFPVTAGAMAPQSSQKGDSRVERNVAYGADSAQKMDVYLPAHPHQAPVLMMVHGGAWMIGNKSNAAAAENKVAHWGPRGYIVISIDYRLLPKTNVRLQAEDVADALAFAQRSAASWGGDPTKFVLMGHSAGAHLVSLLASDTALVKNRGARPWLGTISLDSAALDVPQLMKLPHLELYDRAFGSDPAFWQSVSPTGKLTQAPQPMLMVCSSQRLLSCMQSRQFAAKANSLGGYVQVLPEDLTHADINRTLGLPSSYTDAVDTFLHQLGLP